MYYFLGSDLDSFLFHIKVVLLSFLSVCVRGTVPRVRYDRIVRVVYSLLFPFYPTEVDDLIIASSKVRFIEGGLFYEMSSRNTQNVSVLY
jgi:hypothetical protein